MARRITMTLLKAATDAGVTGARIRHTRAGAVLVGQYKTGLIRIPFPGTAGVKHLSEHRILRELERAIVAANTSAKFWQDTFPGTGARPARPAPEPFAAA